MVTPAELRWQVGRAVRRLSLPGAAALVLAAIAVVLLGRVAVLAPWHGPAKPAAPAAAPAQGVTDEARAAAFYEHLPPRERLEEQLARLFQLAGEHGLVLRQGEYRHVPDAAGRFVRVRMSLPVQGEFHAVQSFIAQSLYELPTLTVESVALRRDTGRSATTDARLQLALMMGAPR